MTEGEAAQKLCPMSIIRNSGNRCFGARCMAWRWDTDFNELMARDPPPDDPRVIADGHCGMAGPA